MDFITAFAQSLGSSLLFLFFYGGIVALIILSVYSIVRLLSKPLAKTLSNFALEQENKAVARLLSPGSRAFMLKGIKNEDQLAQLVKNIAVRNGWKSEELTHLPVWLLTGHIVTDANPNLPFSDSSASPNNGIDY